jgi:subtilase family protein
VRAQEAWAVIQERYPGQNPPRTKVGIYNGFMSMNHPDLTANILPEAPREDWRSVDPKAFFGLSHGTGVMGIIGAAGGRGMHGTAPRAALLPYTTKSSAHDGSMTGALRFFAAQGARVVNFAIAVPWALAEQLAVDEAYDAGVLVVTGLYNADTEGTAYPAAHLRTITASGSGPDDRAMGFGWGPLVDVVAPGTGILTTGMVWRAGPVVFGARYLPLCCNSAACAIVTGIGGLILEHDPTLTSAQVEKRIKLSARKVPEMGGAQWHPRYGYGVADAFGAVTFDKRGPLVTIAQTAATGPGEIGIGGIAKDDIDDGGLDSGRARDWHLFGVPTSNIDRVEYRIGTSAWRSVTFLGDVRDYERAFSVRVPAGTEAVTFRASDTTGNVGPEETLRLRAD